MKITDGKKTVEINMYEKRDNQWEFNSDLTNDVIWLGEQYEYDEDLNAFIVPDIDCVIDYARDWERGEDEDTLISSGNLEKAFDPDSRYVTIDDIAD